MIMDTYGKSLIKETNTYDCSNVFSNDYSGDVAYRQRYGRRWRRHFDVHKLPSVLWEMIRKITQE